MPLGRHEEIKIAGGLRALFVEEALASEKRDGLAAIVLEALLLALVMNVLVLEICWRRNLKAFVSVLVGCFVNIRIRRATRPFAAIVEIEE